MKNLLQAILLIVTATSVSANDTPLDLNTFAKQYFAAFVASQAPTASKQDIEHYLTFLKEDVGHTHLPWQTDGSRLPDGRKVMREGMTLYLGSHTEYDAQLLDVFTFNDSAIAIRYQHHAKGVHPQNKQAVEYTEIMMEVLEMEDGKVAVIRKYHE